MHTDNTHTPQDVYHNIIMVNSHHISNVQRVLNKIYISFLIVVFILIGKLLYLTLWRIFSINISLYATHVFVSIL